MSSSFSDVNVSWEIDNDNGK